MKSLTLTASIAVAAITASSYAGIFSMSVFENSSNTSVIGLNIDILVTQMLPGTVDFKISNNSVAPLTGAGINNIYFESTSFTIAALSSPSIQVEPSGVDFSVSGSPGAPPAGNNIGFSQSVAEFTRTGGGGNRISAGEFLTVRFMLANPYTLANVIASLGNGGFRIGTHTLSVGPNANSVSTVNNIPAPGALGLAALGGLVAIRRRREIA